MATQGFIFTRKHAKMVAEELIKCMRHTLSETMEDIMKDETEEFICLKDAAKLIGLSPSTLYKTKDSYGCYVKLNGRIKFAKNRLTRTMQLGIPQTTTN